MNTKNIIKEFNPIDYHEEKRKITLVFNENKILMLNDFDDKIMYSFFVDRKLIASDVLNENEFIVKFKKYLELDS